MAQGFVYLAAIIDWLSRKGLAWRLSITMDVGFCIEAVEEAMARFGKPDIFNTNQGSQLTRRAFTTMPIGNGIAIGMDSKEAWQDNVFVERICNSVEYEEVCPKAHANVPEARASIGNDLDFCKGRRPRESLGRQTPDRGCVHALPPMPVAA